MLPNNQHIYIYTFHIYIYVIYIYIFLFNHPQWLAQDLCEDSPALPEEDSIDDPLEGLDLELPSEVEEEPATFLAATG